MDPSVEAQLIEILGTRGVATDEHTRNQHSADITENPAGSTQAVVFPQSAEQIQAVLTIAGQNGLSVVPVMANSNLGGLAIPQKESIVINLSRMNRILKTDEQDMYIVIEPGVTWQNISDHLDQHHPGLRFAYPLSPPDTGVIPNCLLDGLANYSLRHGTASHWINGLEVVLADGRLLRTGHWAYGSDIPCSSAPFPGLSGLFVSFQGTTGIVTKMAIQLWPRKQHRRRQFLMAYDVEHAFALLNQLAREDLVDDLGSLSLPTGKMLFGEARPVYKDPNEPTLFLYIDYSSNFERDFQLKAEIINEIVSQAKQAGALFDGPLDLTNLVRLEPRFEKFAKFPTRLDFLLDTPGGGLTWIGTYGPCSRFAEGFSRGAQIMLQHGMPPLIVARPMQGGHFGVLRWITVFDRHNAKEVQDVRQLNQELADMALDLGFFPYKTPQWIWQRYHDRIDPTFRSLAKDIHKLLDPDGMLNPGHLVFE